MKTYGVKIQGHLLTYDQEAGYQLFQEHGNGSHTFTTFDLSEAQKKAAEWSGQVVPLGE